MTSSPNDTAAIDRIVEQYRDGFAALDPELLIALWDQNHAVTIYVAQEKAEPMYGWRQIEEYYRALPTVIPVDRVNEMRVDDVSIDIVGDAASAFCRFHFEGEVDGRAEPFVADGRATFIVHRSADAWKVIHYHESAPPQRRP
jgi:hypothetical protein